MSTSPSVEVPSAQSSDCRRGFCIDNGGDQVDITGGGWEPVPSSPTETPPDATNPEVGNDGGGDNTTPNPVPAPPGPGDLCWDNLTPLGCTTPAPTEPTPTPTQPTYPDTIYNTDLISFTPHDPTATAPNEAMALTNTPLPITLTTTTHTLTGTLLTHPVTVTFTPTGYTLDHGDNTAPTHTADNPATVSHTYTARGQYPTTVTTSYTATVTFPDGIPRPVRGTITTTTPGPTIRILAAHTATVRTTCTTTPAPGC
ncbi:hypothetical protein [Microbacterium nymphoidis]|uniref:hypothetical protein n=1 Tax=Microbacterium nymphoidis TaxID=2898586 RepID=UPI001E3ED688|nr:hypothetical protein [Microbacterium nymphoidis]MCD2498298.1 hypothetical protein [Microbacterium nymphoidis]